MDPLELLNERIHDFPGYATDTDRRLSDEMVRAFLGEMLADLQAKPRRSLTQRFAQIQARGDR
jgi:hypothetical protein